MTRKLRFAALLISICTLLLTTTGTAAAQGCSTGGTAEPWPTVITFYYLDVPTVSVSQVAPYSHRTITKQADGSYLAKIGPHDRLVLQSAASAGTLQKVNVRNNSVGTICLEWTTTSGVQYQEITPGQSAEQPMPGQWTNVKFFSLTGI